MEYNNAACKADRLLVEFKDRKKMLFCEASPFGVLLFRTTALFDIRKLNRDFVLLVLRNGRFSCMIEAERIHRVNGEILSERRSGV